MADEKTTQDETVSPEELKLKSEADAANATVTGVGTRTFYGFTRGRASVGFLYQKFDESKPDTLPKDMQQFMDVTGIKDTKTILGYLIAGHNESLYKDASDPIAEYIDKTWSDEIKAKFRLVVRNYATATDTSIEDSVALVKPGFVKKLASDSAAPTA